MARKKQLFVRLSLLSAFVLGTIVVNCFKQTALADEVTQDGTIDGNIAGLKTTLTKGLRARRPQEFLFIAKVVTYVQMDKLTRKMVLETFHWARRKVGLIRDETDLRVGKYPYPYFEFALKKRAAAIGVKL